jgi:hypothetical protein
LFYRGNDKITETALPNYEDYLNYANKILKSNPSILFLLQSDETEFIEYMTNKLSNTFYFKDEIRHMQKCCSTVDFVFKETNYNFSKYYLAITIIMSKCKYIVCGSGNCSEWIMFYRGNNKNIYQFLNGTWLYDSKDIGYESDWIFIANEGETVEIDIHKRIRYGESNYWIEKINLCPTFQVTNEHFKYDPSPGIKKQLQILSTNV